MPATTVLPIGLSGWQLNIAGIIGLAAVFQWQRLRHYVGAKISAG
jgi:hypothetical protein